MKPGILFAFVSAIALGCSIPIGTVIAKSFHPLSLIFFVYAISFLLLGAIMLITRKPLQFQKLKTHKKDFLSILLTRGILGVILFIYGFSLTLGMRASFIVLLEPAVVILFSRIFKRDSLLRKDLILVLFLILGSYLFITNGFINFDSLAIGDLLIIGGLTLYAYSYLPAAKLSKKVNIQTIMLFIYGISSIFFLTISIPYLQSIPLDLNNYVLLLAFILTGTLVGIFLWYTALKTVRPWVLASLLTTQVLAGALLAFFWLSQALSIIQLVGAAIMLLSAFFISRTS